MVDTTFKKEYYLVVVLVLGRDFMARAVTLRKNGADLDLCNGPIFKKVVRFAIPLYLTNILQLLFNTADLIVVGRFSSSLSVAAVGSTSSLVHLITNLFIGITSGVGVAVATAIGENDEKKISQTVHTAIPLSLICGIIINVAMLTFAYPILKLMGSPADIIELSAKYLKIYACGMIPSMIYNFSAAILRAAGDTVRPLIFLTGSGFINVILNLIFVIGLKMNVAGVALATVISQSIASVLAVMELIKRNDACKLSIGKIRFYRRPLRKILGIGLPAGLQSVTFSASNVIIQSSVNTFGSVAVSGAAAASSLDAFAYCGVDAVYHTAMTFTGQNYGAKKLDRVRRTMFICIATVVIVEWVLGGSMFIFSKPLLSLYIVDSPASIAYGTNRMMFISLMYFLAGIMQVILNTVRGMGHSFFPMLVSVFSNCVFRVLWVLFVFEKYKTSAYSWQILYSSYPISWTCAVFLGIIIYIFVMRKEKKKLKMI